MVDDLSSDAVFRELKDRVRRLETAIPLQNAAVTEGRLRFIGGLLLIDSGGTLTVIGHLNGEGDFEWVGPWRFDSPSGGEIAGDVALSGDFDLTGKLAAGNVRIEGGKIYVGTGGSQVVIDGATGTIIAGDMVITTASGGSITAPAQVVINTPLLDVQGGLDVTQGAVFQGGITASGLLPLAIADAPAGAFVNAVIRDTLGRIRVIVP